MHGQANVGLGLGLPSDVLRTKVNRPLTGLGIFIDSWLIGDDDDEDDDDEFMSPIMMMPAQHTHTTLAPAPVQGTGEKVGLGIFIDCWFLEDDDEELW